MLNILQNARQLLCKESSKYKWYLKYCKHVRFLKDSKYNVQRFVFFKFNGWNSLKVEGIQVAKPAFLRPYTGQDVKLLLWAVKEENKTQCEIKK